MKAYLYLLLRVTIFCAIGFSATYVPETDLAKEVLYDQECTEVLIGLNIETGLDEYRTACKYVENSRYYWWMTFCIMVAVGHFMQILWEMAGKIKS